MHPHLSEEQQRAAYFFDAPLCILAGAGSGKTRVITHRIAHLVQKLRAPPSSILGVTFTNKAAREMRERVERLLPHQAREVNLGTFHSLAARILRGYGPLVRVPEDFLIYDEDDAVRLVKNIIKERYDLPKDEMALFVKRVMRMRDTNNKAPSQDSSLGEVENVVEQYRERLLGAGALDFSGLLQKFLELLQHEQGAKELRSRIRHLVVDEYQDINAIQSQIVHLLAEGADSAAIVGDDDQSIYGWRGASAHYMQEFLGAFKGAQLFRLEDNYRSTKPILDAANALIANNTARLGKTLKSISGTGSLIGLRRFIRDAHEASAVVEQSLRLFSRHGSSLEIAVLMRVNAQSRPLEEALNKAQMPYRMVGGMRFYDRREIKDVLAALKCVLFPKSDVDLYRVLDTFPFGIGKKTIDTLSTYAGMRGLSLLEVMANSVWQEEALGNSRAAKKIDAFLSLVTHMRDDLVDATGARYCMRADEALVYVIDKFAIAKRLEQKNDDESEARLENIEQLVQAAVSFVEEAESRSEPADIRAFLEHVALISKDEAQMSDENKNLTAITLMTLHAAKGLEFDVVFLVGLEEGVLPHSRALQGHDEDLRDAALEEERRLMYVGITRAKTELFLSFCAERFMHGRTSLSAPSRFIKEIPAETIEMASRTLLPRKLTAPMLEVPRKSAAPEHLAHRTSVIYDEGPIHVGSRVSHVTYHSGRVVSLSGEGKMMRAKVHFDRDGDTRTILASHLQAL